MKESITLSSREIQRIHVLERVCRGTMTLVEAVPLLLVCYRQAKRLLARYRARRGPPAWLIADVVSRLKTPTAPRCVSVS